MELGKIRIGNNRILSLAYSEKVKEVDERENFNLEITGFYLYLTANRLKKLKVDKSRIENNRIRAIFTLQGVISMLFTHYDHHLHRCTVRCRTYRD